MRPANTHFVSFCFYKSTRLAKFFTSKDLNIQKCVDLYIHVYALFVNIYINLLILNAMLAKWQILLKWWIICTDTVVCHMYILGSLTRKTFIILGHCAPLLPINLYVVAVFICYSLTTSYQIMANCKTKQNGVFLSIYHVGMKWMV